MVQQQDVLQTADDLERVFHEWHEPIYRYIVSRVRQKTIAEDIAQETFIKAWTKRELYSGEVPIKSWLFTIATNTMRDYFRKQKSHPTVKLDENMANSSDIMKEMDVKEEAAMVFICLQELPEREQELIALRYVQGLSTKDICEILAMTTGAVDTALHRAMKKLSILCNKRIS